MQPGRGTNDVVALLLDDAIPPERIGELLHAARKRRGWKRRQAAAVAHITPELLGEYEKGLQPVPADVCARLAECYGANLTAHMPTRVPAEVNADWLVVGEHRLPRIHGTTEEVVREYAQIVQKLRNAKPGEPLPLRATDLVVLGTALESDAATIAKRVAEILECSVDEARALHREMLRRKVVLPVAGLAASIVALAGVSAAHASSSPHHAPSAGHTVRHPATPVTLAPATTAPTIAQAEDHPVPPAAHVTATTTAQPTTPTTTTPPTAAPPADPPVSVLPGETPITIIDSTAP
jgi:transcriptional regulator with XRE-family HTH domain